jgi:hypothetical protein
MAFSVNSPPPGVAVSTTPSTKELGSRSFNKQSASLYQRRSLNGRRFLPTLNGFPFDLNQTRNILADKFPSGLNSSIDAAQSPNTASTSSPISPISIDNPSFDQDNPNKNSVNIVSPTRTLTVPTNNTGDLLLQRTSGYTTQYKKNAGAWTTFLTNTIVNFANNDTLQFQTLSVDPQNDVQITIIDSNTGQTIGAGDLSNSYNPKDPGGNG